MYQVEQKVIRLNNNTLLIVGLITDDEEHDPDFLYVGDPVEVTFDEYNHMKMKKWMPVSYNGICNIPINMISAYAEPDDETLQKYRKIIYDLENMDQ